MNPDAFCRQSNVVIVIGKGGVGKTTVSAALAKLAANAGLDVLIVALDNSGNIDRLFDRPCSLSNEEVVLAEGTPGDGAPQANSDRVPGRIRARLITADVALMDYLAERGLGSVGGRRIVEDAGALDVVATAAPGIRELLVLGKIKQLERDHVADLIVLDGPATGHAMTLITSPSGLVDAARAGPLRAQAEQVVEFLSNGARCQVLLVTIPEETPINETIETAYRLEDSMYIALGPVVVNGCYPQLSYLDLDPVAAARDAAATATDEEIERVARAASFRADRQAVQHHEWERLRQELPLAQLRLPYLFATALSGTELDELTNALFDAVQVL